MPRLIGKKSNHTSYLVVALMTLVIASGSLEYFGVTNLIPNNNRIRNSVQERGL